MLLTLAWGGSLFLGRCDLDENGEAIEETGKGVNCRKQVKWRFRGSIGIGSKEQSLKPFPFRVN